MSIMVPAVRKVQYKARNVIKQSNFNQVILALGQYDNDYYKYPATVAKGFDSQQWWDPRTMLASKNSPVKTRSVGAYLNSYIDDADIMQCPHAQIKSRYLEEIWQEADEYYPGIPKTEEFDYRVIGSCCLFWNYMGYLPNEGRYFRGAESQSGGGNRLLISDFFSYGHWRGNTGDGLATKSNSNGYASSSCVSCEKMKRACKVDFYFDTLQMRSPCWVLDKYSNHPGVPEVKLYGGYSDGSVLPYNTLDAVKMTVINGYGFFGEYYLPRNALR